MIAGVAAPSTIARSRNYIPLADFLEALPADQLHVQLSFAELEALLGGPLPLSARTQSYYWSRRIAWHWWRVGFTAHLSHGGGGVTFTRMPRS